MSSYKLGNSEGLVRLAVDVSTIGLAATRAVLVIPGSGDPGIPVAHSENATGDIQPTIIGTCSALIGKTISIMTKIDLSIIGDEATRKREFERITAKYFLDGGEEAQKEFEPDFIVPSTDFSTVILSKRVLLTA